ncbi:MAG TPA: TOBE domain-containing protein [Campylobacterales bacterium]|nr:TOBE domain-containing protein [Campylobacterales bacterium]
MKTSARNQLSGKVVEVKKGAVNSEVVLEIAAGAKITAVITNEGSDELALKSGDSATAIIKASWIILATEAPKKISARNCLEGKVVAVKDGAVNAEVVLEVAGGAKITAVVTEDAIADMGLKVGATAFAIIKASSVIISA